MLNTCSKGVNMNNKNSIKKIIRTIILIIGAIALVYLVNRYFARSVIVKRILRTRLKRPDAHKFRYIMFHYKGVVAAAFIIIFALKPLAVFVPSSLICIFAGEYFGPFAGFILNIIGILLSSTVGFYFARALGQSFVNKVFKGKSLKLDDNIEQHGFKIMFTMRISMVFPHDALSYAAGLSKMKYKHFILGTMLGMLPEVLAYSILGKGAEKILSMKFILRGINNLGPYKYIILTIIIITAVLIIIYHHKKHESNQVENIEDENSANNEIK